MKSILVADDDELIVDIISIMLDMAGYKVMSTLDGRNVTKMVEENVPDLILLDIWMGATDGRELCRELKKHPSVRHIPIMIFSASHQAKQSALSAGADCFLEKPFSMGTLLSSINGLI